MRLIPLAAAIDETPEADIVFVHGLDGDWRDTWTGSHHYLFWPKWLGDEFRTCRLWSFDYPAAKSDWFGGDSMALVDRVVGFSHCLENEGVGQRPVIFVTHSLGGLLTIQMLRHREDTWMVPGVPNPFINNVVGMVSFGTPYQGSFWASAAVRFGTVLRPSLSTQDLQRGDRHLADLMKWFRAFVAKKTVPLLAYCETKPLWGIDVVVDSVCADPGIADVVPVPLDCDHVGLCKCQSTNVLFYRGVCKFVRDRLADCRPITDNTDVDDGFAVHLGLDSVPFRYDAQAFTADPDLTLSYKLNRAVEPPRIYPSLPYLDELRRGGLLTARTFAGSAIACSFPALDFKVSNNGQKIIYLSEAEFLVSCSRPLRYPLLIFRDRGPYSLILVNQGSGAARSVDLQLSFSPSGETPIFSGEYRHVVGVGDIEEEAMVDLQSEMAK